MAVMRLSARADYALRAAIELAAASDGHVTADQLARAQQIPGKFLETILTQLRRAGLVRSQRGPEGGFWLARPADQISLADIIRAIDGQLLGVRGERPENVTYPGVAEPLQQVWIALRANERAVLEEVTLADIVSGNLPDTIRHLTENPKAWVLASDGHHIGDVPGGAAGSPGQLPQSGFARHVQHRLALQLGQREVIGNLTEDLGQRRAQRRANGLEQLRRSLFLTTLHFGEVTKGNAR